MQPTKEPQSQAKSDRHEPVVRSAFEIQDPETAQGHLQTEESNKKKKDKYAPPALNFSDL